MEHPAARQLRAYNAPPGPGKAEEFLACFSPEISLLNLFTGAEVLNAVDFTARYRCVFHHSVDLRALIYRRVLVKPSPPPPPGAADPVTGTPEACTFAIDFEHYSGLVAPVGGALDGTTGIADEPKSGDIVVLYRMAGNIIDAMWAVGDDEGLCQASVSREQVEASCAYKAAMQIIGEQFPGRELIVGSDTTRPTESSSKT